MEYVGYFSELNLARDTGSILSLIVFNVDYDKQKMIDYLRGRTYTARCQRKIVDCVTGDYISSSYVVYDDGEFPSCVGVPGHHDSQGRIPSGEKAVGPFMDYLKVVRIARDPVPLPETGHKHESKVVGIGQFLGRLYTTGVYPGIFLELRISGLLVEHP